MSVLLILLTVFLTTRYSEYRKEKRNYEAIMSWYMIELAIIRTEINALKENSEILIEMLKNETPEKSLPLLIFPKFVLESYKMFFSTGCGKYIPYESVTKMSRVYIQLDNLLFIQAHYEGIYPIFFKDEMRGKNFYQGMIRDLGELIKQIEIFHKVCDDFKFFPFPTFFKFILN